MNIFLSYLSLLLNSNKAYKIILKILLDVRKEHIALHITIFVQQYLHDSNCTHNTSYSWWNMEKKEQPYKFTSCRCFCRGWQGSSYKILPASAKILPRKCRGKINFHIVISAFHLAGKNCWNSRAVKTWIRMLQKVTSDDFESYIKMWWVMRCYISESTRVTNFNDFLEFSSYYRGCRT